MVTAISSVKVQLGANASGEVLVPGRVPDCYLGLHLHASDDGAAGDGGRPPPLPPAAPACSPAGRDHAVRAADRPPDRTAHRLVFLADLAVELRAWPTDSWTKVGVDPQAAARAVISGWQRGDLLGVRLGGLSAQEPWPSSGRR
jgi:hypothetical protein